MKLHLQSDNSVTIVDNVFIDRYIANANGEYVKLYLYLLRCAGTGQELSVSSIADFFDHTEKDVQRALSYWEKLELMKLKYAKDGSITDILFCVGEPDAPGQEEVPSGEAPARPALRLEPQGASPVTVPDKHSLTAARKKELREEEDIQQLIFVAETYLGRVLTSTEANNLLYFYDTLDFSFDLVEYLIEYCASRGNPGARYMEKVAVGWYQDGIRTVQQAKKQSSRYSKDYYQIFAAFGIKGRAPAAKEIEYMDRWLRQWELSSALICEACSRTILKAHQPSFSYADRILKNWHEQGALTLEDVARLDEAYAQRSAAQPSDPSPAPAGKVSNRFNNFRQRSYDYKDLEKQLLHAQTRGE